MNFILNILRLIYLFFAGGHDHEDECDYSDINTNSESDDSQSKDFSAVTFKMQTTNRGTLTSTPISHVNSDDPTRVISETTYNNVYCGKYRVEDMDITTPISDSSVIVHNISANHALTSTLVSTSTPVNAGVQLNVSTVTPIKQVFVKPLKFDGTEWRGRGYYLNHSSDKYSVNNEAPLHDLKFQNVTPLQKLKPLQNMTTYSSYEGLHEDEAEPRFSAPLSLQDVKQHISNLA